MQKTRLSLIVSYYLGCLACRLKAIRKDRKIPCFRRFSACNIPGKHQQRAWPAPTYRLNAYSLSTLAVTIVLVCMSAKVLAGNLEPPGPPGSSNSAMYTIEAVYQRLDNGTPGTKWTGGFREPPGPPGPTMHDMNEVMAKAPSRDDTNGGTTNDMLSGKTFWGLDQQ